MSITIYDVAREASVSMATVSRVINGNQNVKPATRKKVLAVIEALGYRPNAVARGLASKKSTTVGVIIPDISTVFYAELVRGIEDIATMYRYNILLSNSDERESKEVQLIEAMLGKQVDGIVFMSDHLTDSLAEELLRSPVPVVLAGTVDRSGRIPSVNIDYEEAAYTAVQELLHNGHRRIAFVCRTLNAMTNQIYKLQGYRRALRSASIEGDPALVLEGPDGYDDGLRLMEVLREMDEPPTAIFAGNDEVAIGLIHGAQDAGLRVPEDIEIISFESTKLARMVRPELTSIGLPLYDIGAVSMRLLTKFMSKEKIEEATVLLPYRIDYRHSTKAREKN